LIDAKLAGDPAPLLRRDPAPHDDELAPDVAGLDVVAVAGTTVIDGIISRQRFISVCWRRPLPLPVLGAAAVIQP
jgi:hypothetical protein